jgi:hypothetical protein
VQRGLFVRCYNAAMSKDQITDELFARLIKLEEQRAEFLLENTRQRLEILGMITRRDEKPADPPPKSP